MSRRLGEILADDGVLTDDELQRAITDQLVFGGHLTTSILELGILDESTLGAALSRTLKVPYTDRDAMASVPCVVQALPARLAEKHKVIPLRVERRNLHLAMVDPTNILALDEISFVTGHKIIPSIALEVRVLEMLETYYGVARSQRYLMLAQDLNNRAKAPAGRATARRSSDHQPGQRAGAKAAVAYAGATGAGDVTLDEAPPAPAATPAPQAGSASPRHVTVDAPMGRNPINAAIDGLSSDSGTLWSDLGPVFGTDSMFEMGTAHGTDAGPWTDPTPRTGAVLGTGPMLGTDTMSGSGPALETAPALRKGAVLGTRPMRRTDPVPGSDPVSVAGTVHRTGILEARHNDLDEPPLDEDTRPHQLRLGPDPSPGVTMLGAAARRLADARSVDDVFATVLSYAAVRLPRCMIFVPKARDAVLWSARFNDSVDGDLAGLRIPIEDSIFSLIDGRDPFYVGAPPRRRGILGFYEMLGFPLPKTVVVVPITVQDRIAAYLYADGGSQEILALDIPAMQSLCARAGSALQVLILRNKILSD